MRSRVGRRADQGQETGPEAPRRAELQVAFPPCASEAVNQATLPMSAPRTTMPMSAPRATMPMSAWPRCS